uniref:Uncharacterized protein n=1 Tax=Panagrolaimus sp. ES5 TaxID=591445 RepID=A0AC34FHZ3_9BILA
MMENGDKNGKIFSDVSKVGTEVLKLKNLEVDLDKAKDIAKLGAEAIDNEYLSTLFNSEVSLADLVTNNPVLSDIYKNVHKLVHNALKKKEENLKLENRIKQLLKNAGDNKNAADKLQTSMSMLEKENNQLIEMVKQLEKKDEEWQQKMINFHSDVQDAQELMEALHAKVETTTEKLEELKDVETECQALKTTVNNLLNIKQFLEEEALTAITNAEKANKKNEDLESYVETLSSEKEKLKQQCLKVLNEIEEHKKEFGYLQSKCRNSDKKIVQLLQSEKVLEEEKEAMETTIAQLKNDKQILVDENLRLYSCENRLKIHVQVLENDLKCQKDENTTLKISVSTFGQKVVSLEKNVEELKDIIKKQEYLAESNVNLIHQNGFLKNNVATLEIRNDRQAGELKRFCQSSEALALLFKKKPRI